jgi:hypothetical protein
MPLLYFHIPSIPFYAPKFLVNFCVKVLLYYRKKRYGRVFRLIRLAKGKYAEVDPADYDWLNAFRWQCYENSSKNCYAVRIEAGKILNMHRLIMNAPAGFIVDHGDGNGLNNTRSNLQIVTHSQNCCNRRKTSKPCTSKYKGVYWDKRERKWLACIYINGKRIYLGRFDDELQAAKAYDEAAKLYHKNFAVLNFG